VSVEEEREDLGDGIEFRTFHFELRAMDGASPRIEGYAAVYNSNSEEMGFYDKFVERITTGAFDGVLGNDVRGLVNHDPNFVLGRTKSGTLRLSADSKGLHSEITPPDTQWARDLMVSMKRGDIDQMSFGFTVAKGGEHVEQDGAVRVIDKIGRLFDVSVVTFPAYPATSVQARNYMESLARVRQAPEPQRGPLVLSTPRFTAVSHAQLTRRLHAAADFDLHALRPRKEP
jgi:HK97 family phage prohead protease